MRRAYVALGVCAAPVQQQGVGASIALAAATQASLQQTVDVTQATI